MTDRDFFTADTHFNHGMIIKYSGREQFMTPEDKESYDAMRASGSVQEYQDWKPSIQSRENMDAAMIENINAVVPADATLWHLGDFSFTRSASETARYRNAINCQDIRLIWGNHDKRKAYSTGLFQAYYEATMIYVFNYITLTEAQMQDTPSLRRKFR
ncbi:MAG: hypothetical protein KAT58_06155, partial [candidate division Zixibacteria bacterium]|nr:hypothetical protein [candidate division Zixibacteria bacterium]